MGTYPKLDSNTFINYTTTIPYVQYICWQLNCVQVAAQPNKTLNLGYADIATARALKEAHGDSLQGPGLHFPDNQWRVNLILHPWRKSVMNEAATSEKKS